MLIEKCLMSKISVACWINNIVVKFDGDLFCLVHFSVSFLYFHFENSEWVRNRLKWVNSTEWMLKFRFEYNEWFGCVVPRALKCSEIVRWRDTTFAILLHNYYCRFGRHIRTECIRVVVLVLSHYPFRALNILASNSKKTTEPFAFFISFFFPYTFILYALESRCLNMDYELVRANMRASRRVAFMWISFWLMQMEIYAFSACINYCGFRLCFVSQHGLRLVSAFCRTLTEN